MNTESSDSRNFAREHGKQEVMPVGRFRRALGCLALPFGAPRTSNEKIMYESPMEGLRIETGTAKLRPTSDFYGVVEAAKIKKAAFIRARDQYETDEA